MSLNEILLSVLLISSSSLVIYLIFSLKKLNKLLEDANKDLNEVSNRTLPLIDNLEHITGKVAQTVDEVDDKINEFKDKLEIITDKLSFKKNSETRSTPEDRARGFVQNLQAFSKGIAVFWENMKK